MKLLVQAGRACQKFHDEKVVNLKVSHVECDEQWSFVYSKRYNTPASRRDVAGDIWTWLAIDRDTRLAITWLVGRRTHSNCREFMMQLASKVDGHFTLTTDGFTPYAEAVENALGPRVDYAQLVKLWDDSSNGVDRKYPLPKRKKNGLFKKRVIGSPDMEQVHTNFIERNNLSTRMFCRRLTRMANGFSRKVENHQCALALHYTYYNFCRIHTKLRVTPAMEARLMDDVMSIEQILELTDAFDGNDGDLAPLGFYIAE